MSCSKERGRIIALDVGSVRIGVAASDPLGAFAQAIAVLNAGGGWMDDLSEILNEYGAGRILVGMPVRTDGAEGPEAVRMRDVMASLAERFPECEIIAWDERFTTAIANQALIEADVSRASRRRKVDKIAAAILLQSYLDSNGRERGDAPPDAGGLFSPPDNEGGRGRRGGTRGARERYPRQNKAR